MHSWAVTFILMGGRQHTVVVFFQGKKDAGMGMRAWRELLDPARNPHNNNKSIVEELFPDVDHLILSGDTGNGFRSYPMLNWLSTVSDDYGYNVSLVPLAPQHAHNRTDAFFARINSLFKKLKKKARLVGYLQFATVLLHVSRAHICICCVHSAQSHVMLFATLS